MRDGQLAGILTRGDLLRGLSAHGSQSRVRDAMNTNVPIVEASDGLDAVLGRLAVQGTSAAAIVQDGRFVGLITADAVARFLSIQAALEHLSPSVT